MDADPTAHVEVAPRPEGVPADLGRPIPAASKSHLQRALVLAAGATRPVTLRAADPGGDVAVMVAALRALGARIDVDAQGLVVRGPVPGQPGLRPGCRGRVDLGENGTALRVLPAVVGLLGGAIEVTGAPRLGTRPRDALVALLAQAGVQVSSRGLPFGFDAAGARWPRRLRVDAATTTQVATGAVLGLALRPEGGEILAVRPRAHGYLAITAEVARAFGRRVAVQALGEDLLVTVGEGALDPPPTWCAPPDASALVFPAVLAALHGITSPRPDAFGHPDAAIHDDVVRLTAAPGHTPLHLDLGSRPDSFPALCVLAATREGTTALRGAPALRAKESDRVAALATALRTAGVVCDEHPDGLTVRGPLRDPGRRLDLPAPADHRVVMALALLGTRLRVGVRLPHPDAVAKSWPGYFDWLGRVAAVTLTASTPGPAGRRTG